MGSWLDRMARRAASTPASATPSPARPTSDDSRRSFIKKAAVVTGAAWSVPVLQSVVAPAYAASGDLGSACKPGGICTVGFCGPGNICGSNGAVCTSATQCVSGGCANGFCVAAGTAPPGAMCLGGASCQYNNCSSNGYCGGTGASCGTDAQCASTVGNACLKGVCKKFP